MRQCIEKGLDSRSEVAIAEGDIKSFYDLMDIFKVCTWMEEDNFYKPLIQAFAALQMLPCVVIKFRKLISSQLFRTKGGLTGTRNAGLAGKIILFDSCIKCSQMLYHLGWHVNGIVLSLSTWVDNLWSVSSNPIDACSIISFMDQYLLNNWGVWLGEESKHFMVARGLQFDNSHPILQEFQEVYVMKALGMMVSNDNSMRPDFVSLRQSLWKAFWGNSGSIKCKACSLSDRVKLWIRCTDGLIRLRVGGWAFQKQLALEIDRAQRKQCVILMKSQTKINESSEAYGRRVSKAANAIISERCKWSVF